MERFRFFFAIGLVASVGVATFIACTPPPPKKAPLRTTPDRPGDDDDNQTDDDDDTVKPIDVKPSDPPLPDGGAPPGRIFAHTPSALYLFDPIAKTLVKIGDFSGLDSGDEVIDIALDSDSNIYGTTFNAFIQISPTDAKVTYIKKAPSAYPNALGFMPKGTVDPTKETLVGYGPPISGSAKNYLKIDTMSGELTQKGDLNETAAAVVYVSAGDIISMRRTGGAPRAFAVIKRATPNPDAGPDAGPESDKLAEIDPATGKIKTIIGDIGSDLTYGLAQWAGVAYAFNAYGEIREISLTGGKGKSIMTLQLDGGAGKWYGAGVSTEAPTEPTEAPK